MRIRYGALIQSSEEVGFMYSEGLSLLCCDMYVEMQCMFLAAITPRLHTAVQEFHLGTACTFSFDPAKVTFAKLLILH